jgi:aminoglycoside phosphotransferase (APT) family kinase protein
MQTTPGIMIAGESFKHIVSRELVSIYRGQDAYLRIGPEDVLRKEMEAHRRLHDLGFPVPPLIRDGEHKGLFYYIEMTVGETFGDIFDHEAGTHSNVREESFDAFLSIVIRYAQSQLQNQSSIEPTEAFRHMLRVNQVMEIFPELAWASERAFGRIMDRLAVFPAVLTHGDFHAFNVCERGVIDFESVAPGFAGYDVTVAIMLPGMFPPADDEFSYSTQQIERYLTAIDTVYQAYGLPNPSAYTYDYLVARLMWLVAGRKRPPALLDWLDTSYREMLTSYLRDA